MISVPNDDPQAAIRILSSVARFATLPETMGMRDWLDSELMRLHQANQDELDDRIYRQRQGACQVLGKIKELMKTADTLADKIRANQRKP